MTDHFALFGEARRPWLDAEKLKEKYFAKARAGLPNEQLNEAFRILSDPKLRLQHFLQLEGADLATGRPVPAAMAGIFWQTGTLLREIDRWLLRESETTSTLARAILQTQRLKLEDSLGKLETDLRANYEEEILPLARENISPNDDLGWLVARYDSISYLKRLLAQIDEKRLQLSTR